MPHKLSITNLSKTFTGGRKPIQALSGIDLQVSENEFVTVVGTSGCGKSTLLSIIAGLQTQTGGDVQIDGVPVTGPGRDRGVVFQTYTLLPWLTAEQNIIFALKAVGHSRSEAKELARGHLKSVGLDGFAGAYPNQLSGGMKQRVAIARALSYRPQMLLMDEPFGALDALTRHHMQELLTRIWERDRTTVFFITHDVEEAVYLSDRVAVMSNRPGRIKEIIPIDLPRPRRYDMLGTVPFQLYTKRVLGSIREESLAAAGLAEDLVAHS